MSNLFTLAGSHCSKESCQTSSPYNSNFDLLLLKKSHSNSLTNFQHYLLNRDPSKSRQTTAQFSTIKAPIVAACAVNSWTPNKDKTPKF